MLDVLKFVKGAVAKNDYMPALTHFYIHNGFIKGFNGQVALCAPLPIDLTASPSAAQFIKAIECCDETPALHLDARGNLVVRSGRFKAIVPCTTLPFPDVAPQGYQVDLNTNLLETFKLLLPFISDDASRIFPNSVLLRGQSAYATINHTLVERWMNTPFPIEASIPKGAVEEVIRINEEPRRMSVDTGSVTFLYDGGRWLRTQLYDVKWPNIEGILNVQSTPAAIPAEFFVALKKIAKFASDTVHNSVYIDADQLYTNRQEENTGATVGLSASLGGLARFNCDYLRKLEHVCTEIDIKLYPNACQFFNRERLIRGAIMGLRNE